MGEKYKYDDMIADFNPDTIKAVVFDVDDTITRGTIAIKAEAWDVLFPNKQELVREARELYEYTGKGDRYNIIAHIIGAPQDNCFDNEAVQQWAQRFEATVQKNVRDNGIHQDDLHALEYVHQIFPEAMYVLSVTPQKSVEENIQFFATQYPSMQNMFVRIIGTPLVEGKAGALRDIAKENNCNPGTLVVIGDGNSDYQGAYDAGTQFIGVNPNDRADKWPQENFPKVPNISHILELL